MAARDYSFYGLEMKEEAYMAIKLGTNLAHDVTGNNLDVRNVILPSPI